MLERMPYGKKRKKGWFYKRERRRVFWRKRKGEEREGKIISFLLVGSSPRTREVSRVEEGIKTPPPAY